MTSNSDTTSIDLHVGAQLHKVRKLKNLSQSQVADILGVTYQQIQKYETGKTRISTRSLIKLSEILNIPSSYFFETLPQESKDPKSSISANAVPEEELLKLISLFLRIHNSDARKALLIQAREYSETAD